MPLLLYPPPSVTRAEAIDTLERAGRSWRIAFTSASLTGLSAAARAGIGLMPHSARLMPAQLATVAPHSSLPALPEIEFVVIGPGAGNPVADALIAAMLHWAGGAKGRGCLLSGDRLHVR